MVETQTRETWTQEQKDEQGYESPEERDFHINNWARSLRAEQERIREREKRGAR